MEGGYLKKAIVLIIIFIFLGSAFSTQVIGNHMNHDLYRSNSCSCPNEIIDVYVTYSERKIPVDHATVVLKSGYNHRETLTTNNKGFCRFEGDYNSFIYDTTVTANKDFCFSRTVNLGKISDREYQRVKIVLRNVLPIE
ncbi:MAG: hypothetical protein KGY65_07475, partial [Candidatus Thermoplasmatota archaeon]|nr:hypothetical protein [Candidatus Thermoplasmatota archaeon]